ncbi:MAG: DJ-1/PfpI family protein [Eubacteriaceae bacterium]|jgi:4-methyl-5(b-hydroxyethyl)-thiazole monophosphate biosynthesis|nr:DJ-1/PfpI family protein [Eubacteriaceae bacterium]
MVYVHLAEGFEEVEAVTIVDVLRRGGVETETVSTGGKCVAGAHGITVTADTTIDEADYDSCEMIVFPGGMPGTTNLQKDKRVTDIITAFAKDKTKWTAAICAAPMIFGGLGILEGKAATIYPGMEGELKGAVPSSDKVVIDGNIVTSQAPGTSMQFGLALVELLKGKDTAEEVREGLVY